MEVNLLLETIKLREAPNRDLNQTRGSNTLVAQVMTRDKVISRSIREI